MQSVPVSEFIYILIIQDFPKKMILLLFRIRQQIKGALKMQQYTGLAVFFLCMRFGTNMLGAFAMQKQAECDQQNPFSPIVANFVYFHKIYCIFNTTFDFGYDLCYSHFCLFQIISKTHSKCKNPTLDKTLFQHYACSLLSFLFLVKFHYRYHYPN